MFAILLFGLIFRRLARSFQQANTCYLQEITCFLVINQPKCLFYGCITVKPIKVRAPITSACKEAGQAPVAGRNQYWFGRRRLGSVSRRRSVRF